MLLDLEVALKNFQNYCESYNNYIENYSFKTPFKSKTIISNQSYNLECYKGLQESGQKFLIVPSLINNADIFLTGDKDSFIGNLIKHGDVYLINWKDTNEQTYNFKLNDSSSLQ